MKPSSKCHLIVVGAQKAGTTWLHNTLEYQDEFWCPSDSQEVHYFDRYYDRGYKKYESKYDSASINSITFDVTPDYLCNPLVPRRIKEYRKVSSRNIKLLALLRDPVERAISAYKMKVRKGGYSLPLSKAIEVDTSILNKSKYTNPIKKYKSYFKENFKLILSERFFKKTGKYLEDIRNFVGAERDIQNIYSNVKVNDDSGRGGGKPYVRSITSILRFMGAKGIIHEVKRLDWSKYLREKIPSERKPIVDDKGVHMLREELSDEVRALAAAADVPEVSSIWCIG